MPARSPEDSSVRRFNAAARALADASASGSVTEELVPFVERLRRAREDEQGRIAVQQELRTLPAAEQQDGVPVLPSDTCPDEITCARQRGALVLRGAVAHKVMLPVCGPRWLPAPEVVVRGSLFGLGTHRVVKVAINGKQAQSRERISFRKKEKPCGLAGDVQLFYRGPALDQGDLDVWLRLLEMARDDLDAPVFFTLNALLTELGRNNGGKDFELLVESLERLAEGRFSVAHRTARGVLDMSLVREVLADTASGRTKVTLDIKAARLFGTEKGLSWTKLQRVQRRALAGKEAALWLHACLSSHARPIPLKLADLHEACGSNASLPEFRRMLEGPPEGRATVTGRGALDLLVRVGFLTSWQIEAGLLKVRRSGKGQASSQLKVLKESTGKAGAYRT